MHIVITGATSVVGRAAAARLLAAGHRVTGVAQRPHACLDRRVELVRATLDHPVLQDLADDADVLLHLAPIEADVPESAGIAGVVRVTHAAARAGARLLFASQAAGDPALYRQAEELVSSSWTPSLVIRMALPVGRHPDWMVSRTVATLATSDLTRPVRVLHTDDLYRFLVRAVGSHRTGTVDLATMDTVAAVSARRSLSAVAGRPRRIRPWPQPDPDIRVVPLQREWEFTCGWSAAEAVADTGRALAGHRLCATGADPVPGQAPVEVIPRDGAGDAPGLRPAAREAGEFDDVVDPAYPVFSARGTSDALPGPLTPMTLDVHCAGLRAAHSATGEIIGLRGPLAREWQQRAVAVFAHRLFTGESVGRAVSAQLARTPANAAMLVRAMSIARHYDGWCGEYTGSRHPRVNQWSALSDAALEVRIPLLCNQIHQGWVLSTVGTLLEGLLARVGGQEHPVVPLPAATTSTHHLATETAALAQALRADARLRELAAAADLAGIRAAFPATAAMFEAALTRVGHRGPGEAELANPVIAEASDQLLVAAARAAADVPAAPRAPDAGLALPLHRAENVRLARELAWDTTVRFTHELRMALREKGSRLAARRLLACRDNVFYLTLDEALAPPVDTRLRVNRRRAERERLQALNMPEVVDGRWAPLPEPNVPELVASLREPMPQP